MKTHLSKFTLSLIVFTSIFFISWVSVQDDKKGLARVQKIMGKEVYVLSEPIREYTTVGQIDMELSMAPIQKKMTTAIDRGLSRVRTGKITDFDAALTSDGSNIIFIKFKE